MTASVPSGELRPLTSFRFLAAFFVFLFHIQIRVPLVDDGPLKTLFSEGAVGMTMFFMLSGFILTHVYQERLNLKKYFLNRFARVYPIYLLAAVLALPWILVDLSGSEEGTSSVYTLIQVVIILLFGLLLLQAWLPQLFVYWNNSASWSISNEAFFYGCFPLIRAFLLGFSRGWLAALLILTILVSALIPVSAYVFENTPNPSFFLFYSNPAYRIPEFFAGCLVYLLFKDVDLTTVYKVVLYIIAVPFVAYLSLWGDIFPIYTFHNFLGIPAIGACLVLLWKMPEQSNNAWNWRISVWLGHISYCFYSFQFHVLEGLPYIVDMDQISPVAFGAMSFVLLLGVSAVGHHLVEEPCRKWLRSRANSDGFVFGSPKSRSSV